MTRSNARINRHTVARGGFTLTEVLLVLAILGVIAAMVVPNLIGQQKAAMIKATRMSIKSLEDASRQYAVAHDGEYPTTGDGTAVLLAPGVDQNGKQISPFLNKPPKDAWGIDLNYAYPNNKAQNSETPAIWSNGPNKINDEGAGDDVNNWN